MKCWASLQMCVFVALVIVLGEALNNEFFTRNRRARVCGKQLSNALSMVCDSNYYTPSDSTRTRRSHRLSLPYGSNNYNVVNGYKLWPVVYESRHPTNEIDLSDERHPFRGGSEHMPRLIRKGIVEECCHKSCTYHEMKAYCGKNEEPSDEDLQEVYEE